MAGKSGRCRMQRRGGQPILRGPLADSQRASGGQKEVVANAKTLRDDRITSEKLKETQHGWSIERQSMEDINGTLRNHVFYSHYTIYVLNHIVVMLHRPLINAQ